MLSNIDVLPKAAGLVVKHCINGRMMKKFDKKMWENLGIDSAFDQTALEAELELTEQACTPKTWLQLVKAEVAKPGHGKVSMWWGALKETYLKQMETVHSAVMEARRFNHVHAIEQSRSKKVNGFLHSEADKAIKHVKSLKSRGSVTFSNISSPVHSFKNLTSPVHSFTKRSPPSKPGGPRVSELQRG